MKNSAFFQKNLKKNSGRGMIKKTMCGRDSYGTD